MISLRIYERTAGFRDEDGAGGLAAALAGPDAIVWISLVHPTADELTGLESTLHLHPMTMEDLEHEEDRPRLRQYGDILSLVFFAVRGPIDGGAAIEFDAINLFAGKRFLVTIVRNPVPEMDEAFARWRDDAARLPVDAGAPLYCVLDTLVDGYFPVIDAIADEVDEVEDQVVEQHSPAALPAIFALKKSMLKFRRVASAARDVVNTLLRHDDIIGGESDIFLQDVYDHVVRITDSVDTYRDLLGNAMETYLSVASNQLAENSNKLNITMQTLTSWSIIIGTAAFVTGVYGMNVDGIPFLHHRNGFVAPAAAILGATIALLAVFRRKGWV